MNKISNDDSYLSWLVFSYSLPSKSGSSQRVALWRRLRRIGAVSVKTSFYILPAQDQSLESFQWLAKEVQEAKGEAVIIHVRQFEGLADHEIIELFQQARQLEYNELLELIQTLHSKIASLQEDDESLEGIREELAKLRKRYKEILLLDFFDCPGGTDVAIALKEIEASLCRDTSSQLKPVGISQYQNKSWVTRPRPFIDRLACIWLIRRFIDADAVIRYSLQPKPEEIGFDMAGAEFGHLGNLCSFETMIQRFELTMPPLQAVAEIVHVLDLQDRQYIYPETDGVASIVRGWLLMGLSDLELETRGMVLFDGLYAALCQSHQPPQFLK